MSTNTLTERERNRRNLNPHKAALIAMWLYARRYASQGGGSMDFWGKLSKAEQQTCRECVKRLETAPEEK